MALDTFADFWALLSLDRRHPRQQISLIRLTEEQAEIRGLGRPQKGFSWYYYCDWIPNFGSYGYIELDTVRKERGRYADIKRMDIPDEF